MRAAVAEWYGYRTVACFVTARATVPELDEIGIVIEEIVDLAMQINLEVNSDDVQELLNSHNRELATDELIERHGQEQGIDEL
ncbi:hypothetical protein TNCV_1583241 [Trichonephila clavipes]|nr:hypothetical protein TNCV_1583241 [Trichonephila clavipes]